jgi:catechol-2,3-dioxygenase
MTSAADALNVRPRAFHVSLNVTDLGRAVAFYEALFGTPPAKRRPDYAKFEVEEPPLVLSLEPARRVAGTTLNHLGLRMPESEVLVDIQRRLEDRGYSTRREQGVACCYARQTKFWVHDPDGRRWEVYVLEEDLDHRGAPTLVAAATNAGQSAWCRLKTAFGRMRRRATPVAAADPRP